MNVYGRLALLIGVLNSVPLLVIPFYPDERRYLPAFLIPLAVSVALGIYLCRGSLMHGEETREWRSPLSKGSLPVLFVWVYSILIGAIPFMIGGQLSFVKAIFESVSGWTTTGLTVADVTVMPHVFLLHRSFMQYCGGLGFIIMMSALVQNKLSVSLYNAEGHYDRLMPSLKRTSRFITAIYSVLLILGSMLYRLFGMDLFDAVCHTMSALSTAGFSTRAGSIGEYASRPIELITIFLMLIGASNFAVLMLLFKGRLRRIARVSETRFMLGVILLFTVPCAISLALHTGMNAGDSMIEALFGIVTTFSTTGYSTMDYINWPPFAVTFLLPLMIIGGCAGSTAGGIKLSRTYLMIRAVRENIRKRVSANRKVTVPTYMTVRGKTQIDDALILDTVGFIACYLGIIVIGTLLLILTARCSPYVAFFEFTSAFGTVGITDGLTSVANNATLIVEMIAMILGRLEIFIVFVGFYEVFRTSRKAIKSGYIRRKERQHAQER